MKLHKIRATSRFKVIQGHRYWYKSKAHIRLLTKTIARQVVLRIKSWRKFTFAKNSIICSNLWRYTHLLNLNGCFLRQWSIHLSLRTNTPHNSSPHCSFCCVFSRGILHFCQLCSAKCANFTIENFLDRRPARRRVKTGCRRRRGLGVHGLAVTPGEIAAETGCHR